MNNRHGYKHALAKIIYIKVVSRIKYINIEQQLTYSNTTVTEQEILRSFLFIYFFLIAPKTNLIWRGTMRTM